MDDNRTTNWDHFIGAEAIDTGADGQPVLLGSRCRVCQLKMSPPSVVCPACGSEDLAREEQPHHGVLYSYTTLHVSPPRWHRPMVLGYVDLPNDVRVFAHLKGSSWSVGQRVTLDVDDVGTTADGQPLRALVFRSAEPA